MLGAATYAVLLALAVLTMMRSGDESIYRTTPSFDLQWLGRLVVYPFEAVAPGLITKTVARLLRLTGEHLISLLLLLASPIVACWIVTRNRVCTLEFAVTYLGVLLFALLWHFAGTTRHHGIVFLAFVGAVWVSRATTTIRRGSWLWLAILSINAAAGLQTLSLRPFSYGREAASWIERNGLGDALIIGSPDYAVSTVAGFLRRPIYYLECECRGTYIVWSARRQRLDDAELMLRTVRAVESSGRGEAVLILNRELTSQQAAAAPQLVFEMSAKFTGSIVKDEDYVVYRVRLR